MPVRDGHSRIEIPTGPRGRSSASVESVLLVNFEAEPPAAPTLERPVDVVRVATKATQLGDALERVPENAAEDSVVVPLLNGLDYVELLRRRFGPTMVLPAAIAIESERVEPGFVRHRSHFASVRLSPAPQAEDLRAELVDAGIAASVAESEAGVLWEKLAMLAPIALTTTLRSSALGGVVADPVWCRRLEACIREVAAAAREEGVLVDPRR